MNAQGLINLEFTPDMKVPCIKKIKNYMKKKDVSISLVKYFYGNDCNEREAFIIVAKIDNDLYFKKLFVLEHFSDNEYSDEEDYHITPLVKCKSKEAIKLKYHRLGEGESYSMVEVVYINTSESEIKKVCPNLMGSLLSAYRNKSANK